MAKKIAFGGWLNGDGIFLEGSGDSLVKVKETIDREGLAYKKVSLGRIYDWHKWQ